MKQRKKSYLSIFVIFFSLFFFGIFMYNDNLKSSIADFTSSNPFSSSFVELPPDECDLFTGQWVFDNKTYPLYKEEEYDPEKHSIIDRIIMPESIEKHGVNWIGVDFLVFNSYIWWMNTVSIKVLRGSFDDGDTEYDEIKRPIAYERVLRTLGDWVDHNIDPLSTTVFFMSMSPLHIKSSDWANPEGIRCALETTPILNMSFNVAYGQFSATNYDPTFINVKTNFLISPETEHNEMKQTDGRERKAYLSLLYFAVILLPVFLLGCYLYNEKQLRVGQFQEFNTHNLQEHITPLQQSKEDKDKKTDLVPLEFCDVFTGKWVLDNVTHPLYKEDEFESNADPPDKRDGKTDPVIIPNSISKHGENWKDADYLIFNTYIWWTRHSTIKVLSSDWGFNEGSKCEKETEPILNMSKPINVGTNRRLYEIALNATKSTKVPIHFLNITTMSEYRKDGHTSFYGSINGKLMTPEQKLDPRTFADCYHWCLPGLPDSWNELLSLYIIYKI
nr:hypothetical protein [Arabidopsis thaliana]